MRHYPEGTEKKETSTLTIRELKEAINNLPDNAEVLFTDVCGTIEAELYEVEINAEKGIVILVGETTNE